VPVDGIPVWAEDSADWGAAAWAALPLSAGARRETAAALPLSAGARREIVSWAALPLSAGARRETAEEEEEEALPPKNSLTLSDGSRREVAAAAGARDAALPPDRAGACAPTLGNADEPLSGGGSGDVPFSGGGSGAVISWAAALMPAKSSRQHNKAIKICFIFFSYV
jgi:hypothetical protein